MDASNDGVLHWHWPEITLDFPPKRPYVVGILNVTPDSFSDGGAYPSVESAVAAAVAMIHDGAAVIDIGGMSTRPGFAPIDQGEEERRVIPVLTALREALTDLDTGRRVLISLDTDKPALAEKALRLGLIHILNDVSGGDTAMAVTAATYSVPLILMHRPATEDRGALASVMEDLAALHRRYVEAGLPADYIALDPGLGFGKNEEENLALLRECRCFLELGAPLYIGASRKRFIGKYADSPLASERLGGSIAAALWAAAAGAAFVRVHDVRETVEALNMHANLCAAHIKSRLDRQGCL